MASWVNQRLALTNLHDTGEVYEAHVAFKLSALQFGEALIDYHEAVKKSHLYEAIDIEDCLHRTWFWTDMIKLCKDIIGDELMGVIVCNNSDRCKCAFSRHKSVYRVQVRLHPVPQVSSVLHKFTVGYTLAIGSGS